MKVFIVGSMREISEDKQQEMGNACRNLGAVFARAGHSLILGSDAPDSADFSVVEGANTQSQASPHKVYVYRTRRTDHRPFGDQQLANVSLHVRDDFKEQTAAHVRSVLDSDVVLLIGGRQKTLAAGYVAHALDKPYLPIPCFGGSSAELWLDFEARYRFCKITDTEFEAVKWRCDGQAVLACCKKLHTAFRHPKPVAEHRRLLVEPFWGPPAELKTEQRPDVFILMPFAKQLDFVHDCLKGVANSLGLTARRADELTSVSEIMQDVWASIVAARVVIADITMRNANVFYELGLAHTLGKPVVLITQDVKDTPFDISTIRLIEYELSPAGMQKLQSDLSITLSELL